MTVSTVPSRLFLNPPVNPEDRCRLLGFHPEADALNPPTDNQVRPCLLSHGILLSIFILFDFSRQNISQSVGCQADGRQLID
jgi:hypothetical protein